MKDYNDGFSHNAADEEEILDGEIADTDYDGLGDEDLDFADLGDDGIDGVSDDFDAYDELADGSWDDDRLNKVLDELAELKRSMSPSGGSSRPASAYMGNSSYAPPYSGSNASAPGEVALYNEISRLRDELSKTQHSQSMHIELNRMKEEMEKETKQNEGKLLTEIKSLQKQIKALKGDEDADEGSSDSEEHSPKADNDKGINALIKINEALVEYTKSFGSRIESDVEKIKGSIPDLAVLGQISEKLNALRERPIPSPQPSSAKICGERNKTADGIVSDNTEIMRRLVEIKLTLGKLSRSDYERELKVLSLYDSLTTAKAAVYSSVCGFSEKLDAMRKLESEISVAEDCYIADVVEKYNELVDYMLALPLSPDGVDVFAKIPAADKIKTSLSGETLALVRDYVGAVAVAREKKAGGAIDKLPEIVGLKNKLQGNRFAEDNDALYDEILRLSSDLVFLTDAAAADKCAADMIDRIERICYLPYSEFVIYPQADYDKYFSVTARSVVQDFMDEIVNAPECKTEDDAVIALTSAVNLLRSEIASGAGIGGGNGPADLSGIIDGQKDLLNYNIAAREDREKLLSDVEHIKAAIDSLVGVDVDGLADTENEDISRLLEEVKTLHTEVNTLSEVAPSPETVNSSTPDEVNLFLSEIVSLRDEVQSYKDEISSVIDKFGSRDYAASGSDAVAGDNTAAIILDELTAIRADLAGYTDELGSLKATVEDIRAAEPRVSAIGAESAPLSSDISPLMGELSEIRKIVSGDSCDGDKLLAVRDELLTAVNRLNVASDDEGKFEDIKAGIEGVKQQLSDLQLYETVGSTAPQSAADVGDVLQEVASLRDMLASDASSADNQSTLSEIKALREELASLKKEMTAVPAQPHAVDLDPIKSELAELKRLVLMGSRETAASAESTGSARTDAILSEIYENVRMLREEPDYSVMNEILALREEFQALKDRMEKSALLLEKPATDGITAEIRSLRDQIFAINMAAVSDGEEQTYESYNNIIVDEIGAVRDELSSLLSIGTDGITVDTSSITEKLEEVKALMNEARDAAEARKNAAADNEISQLKQTIAEQKETQTAMLELMNKMIEKLDKQEEYSAKITDEIASTLGRDTSAKSDENNAAVMNEIENIKYTLGVMQGVEDMDADADLEESIGKLKAELSQMAGIMEETSAKGEKSAQKRAGARSGKTAAKASAGSSAAKNKTVKTGSSPRKSNAKALNGITSELDPDKK